MFPTGYGYTFFFKRPGPSALVFFNLTTWGYDHGTVLPAATALGPRVRDSWEVSGGLGDLTNRPPKGAPQKVANGYTQEDENCWNLRICYPLPLGSRKIIWTKTIIFRFEMLIFQGGGKGNGTPKIIHSHTVDGSDIPNNHLRFTKPLEIMGYLPLLPYQPVSRIFCISSSTRLVQFGSFWVSTFFDRSLPFSTMGIIWAASSGLWKMRLLGYLGWTLSRGPSRRVFFKPSLSHPFQGRQFFLGNNTHSKC